MSNKILPYHTIPQGDILKRCVLKHILLDNHGCSHDVIHWVFIRQLHVIGSHVTL